MNKRSLATAVVTTGVLLVPAASAQAAAPVETPPAVFLVSGDNAHLVDALTAGPLAGVLGAAILYTSPTPDGISAATLDEIASLHPSQVIVVGGTDVVSVSAMELAIGRTVEAKGTRLSGEDRYATAKAVADYTTDLVYPGARGE